MKPVHRLKKMSQNTKAGFMGKISALTTDNSNTDARDAHNNASDKCQKLGGTTQFHHKPASRLPCLIVHIGKVNPSAYMHTGTFRV